MVATRTRYCGVWVWALWLTGAALCPPAADAGQAPRRKKIIPTPPFAVLLPAEEGWSITLPSPPAAAATHDDERMFVPLISSEVIAIDWETGETVWTAQLASLTSPVAGGNLVFVAAAEMLHALDATTGVEQWSVPTDGPLRVLRLQGSLLLGAGPGHAQAFEAASGRTRWTQILPPSGTPAGLVATSDAAVVTFADGPVFSLSLTDGHVRWRQMLPGTLTAPALADDYVYVGSSDNNFYSLDAGSGKTRWTWRTGGDIVGADADLKAVYYASMDTVVRAVNRGNGHQRWKRDIGTRPLVPPLALDGSVLVTGLAPTLSALAPLTGAPLGTYAAPGEVFGSPLVIGSLKPRRVGLAILLKDGRAIGLRPLGLLFNEGARQPLQALPGKPVPRERLP